MTGDRGVQLQRLRHFTVQIRDAAHQAISGTGIVVREDGAVITCAHVAAAALGGASPAPDLEVGVYVPWEHGAERRRQACVVGVFEDFQDDVVLLRITDGLVVDPGRVAVLGRCDESCGHPFQSYGYRRLDKFVAGWAEGQIIDAVEAPEDGDYQAEPVQLASSQINRGMSGAPLLDKVRNLVVGLVSETWFPDASQKDRDTAWAVDGQVFALPPLSVPLAGQPLPLAPVTAAPATALVAAVDPLARPESRLDAAPRLHPALPGREEILAALVEDWQDAGITMTTLVGFGGEGKSVLARQFVDRVGDAPDGVFWWTFTGDSTADELFDALLDFLTGGKVDPSKLSSAAKSEMASAMLTRSRHVFVLDAVERGLHAMGDRHGQFVSPPLADFLRHCAMADTRCFTLLTSRVEPHDLMSYTTVRHRALEPLSPEDGVELLRRSGATEGDEVLRAAAQRWDGHALTLDLLGRYAADRAGGVLAAEDPAGVAGDDGVGSVLRGYDEVLSDLDRAALLLVSAFRGPVHTGLAFGSVLADWDAPPLLSPLAGAGEEELLEALNRLVETRVLRYDETANLLSMHALVRAYYRGRLAAAPADERRELHERIAMGYMFAGGVDLERWEERAETFEVEALSDLQPVIEAIHHFCQAGEYRHGMALRNLWIDRGMSTSWLSVRLGAPETALDVELQFFVDRDLARPSPVASRNAVAVQLENLGRLDEAHAQFQLAWDEGSGSRSITARNLMMNHIARGDLGPAAEWSARTLATLEQEGDEDEDLWQDLATAAWIAMARGRADDARGLLDRMLEAAVRMDDGTPMIIGAAGALYGECLLEEGALPEAANVAYQTLTAAAHLSRPQDAAQAHCVLGRLWERIGEHDNAGEAFDTAVSVAFARGSVTTQLKALSARGRWAARHREEAAALADLRPALERAEESGYGLFQIHALIGLADVALRGGRRAQARRYAESGQRLARRREYALGVEDAQLILDRTEETHGDPGIARP